MPKFIKIKQGSIKQSMLILAPLLSMLIYLFADLDPENKNTVNRLNVIKEYWFANAIESHFFFT